VATAANKPDVSVVVPVYRSNEVVLELTDRLADALGGAGRDYEIVLVDDGSPDRTWRWILEARARRPQRVAAVRLGENVGQHRALLAGMRLASGELVATMDDDLQHPPEELPKLLSEMENPRLDVVYGRYRTRSDAPLRRLLSRASAVAARALFGLRVPPTPFRLLRRRLVEKVIADPNPSMNVDVRIAQHATAVGGVWIDHAPSRRASSTYNPAKLLIIALDVLRGWPLSNALSWVVATILASGILARFVGAPAALRLVAAAAFLGAAVLLCAPLRWMRGRKPDAVPVEILSPQRPNLTGEPHGER
jgi:undecaprenyl-phosphate 4-deoxy-4-formamido-L-arabinose transferase